MLRDHVAISQEVVSYDCPKCLSGGACFVGMFVNGFRPMSRREQRRARKAKKNAVMYKTYGRRPWLSRKPYGENERDDFINTYDVMARRAFTPVWGGRCDPYAEFLSDRINHLREPSGFKAMSRLADGVTK